jgi:predicted nuclease of restriction endonuclease-like (RecB) superfamily
MNNNLNALLSQISQLDSQLTAQAAKSIDRLLTIRNWLIGGYLFEYEQNGSDRAVYGSKLELTIAESLNRKGLSERNLKLFKQFYLAYPQTMQTVSAQFKIPEKIMQTTSALSATYFGSDEDVSKLIDNLSFSHLTELMKITDKDKRQFYELQAVKGTWSVRDLRRQINSLTYERTVLSKGNRTVKDSKASNDLQSVQSLVKTSFVFDFLDFPDSALAVESDFENALISNLKNFMLELGHGFCFEGQQKRIVIGGEYFFVDLVFYHRILKCHVLIELKVDEFNYSNVGQLNTYLQFYKRNIKESNDNPPIGILLCTDKNAELVEYALGGMDQNLFVSTYQTVLPSYDQLKKFLQNAKSKISD